MNRDEQLPQFSIGGRVFSGTFWNGGLMSNYYKGHSMNRCINGSACL